MRIRLDPERVEPFVWEETQAFPEELVDSSLLRRCGPIVCRGRLQYATPVFRLQVELSYQQVLVCTRCLQPTTQEKKSDFDVVLMIRAAGVEVSSPAEVEVDADELSVIRVDGEDFETMPLVTEHIQLQLPMKPLCREDCLGLCPLCGADRNRTPDCCSET